MFSFSACVQVSGTYLNRFFARVTLAIDVRYSAKFHVLMTKLESNVMLRQCQQAIAKLGVGDTTCQ